MTATLETLVEQAKGGNKHALETMVRTIQDHVYGLSLRMLWHPMDAEDATQEILIKVITHLDGFRGESTFMTWVYRIASNYLLKTCKCRAEKPEISFNNFGETIDNLLTDNAALSLPPEAEQALVVQEIMIGCMLAMLLCLSRDLRIAYILGEIDEIKHAQAAAILNITPGNYRKRLSRARTLLYNFMQKKCGLVNPDNPCRCSRFVSYATALGKTDPDKMLFAGRPCRGQKETVTSQQLQAMGELQRMVMLYRSHPDYVAPETFVAGIMEILDSGRFEIGQRH